jgi:L-alanine-DL-glutamate epimerase-like enolase superfamily enzyme
MTITRIAKVTAEPFNTPLHNPFVTSQGAATLAQGVAVIVTLEDGRMARGESVPVTYVTGETRDSVLETVQQVGPLLVGQDVTRWRQALDIIAQTAPDAPSARCGLEMAVFDALALAGGGSLWQLLGGATDSVESDVTIPIVPNATELTEIAWALGINVFKIKVGEKDVEADHARVLAVRQAAPEARLRIDANQAFTPDGAVAFAERLVAEGANVELLEQPVQAEDFEGLAEVARRSPVPVFADESCRTPQDALRLAQTPVHGFNLKINKSGIGAVLDILAIARAAGKKRMLGCMLETRRSIAVSLAIACGTGAFDFLDLDSHLLLAEDGHNPYFDQVGGKMTLPASK